MEGLCKMLMLDTPLFGLNQSVNVLIWEAKEVFSRNRIAFGEILVLIILLHKYLNLFTWKITITPQIESKISLTSRFGSDNNQNSAFLQISLNFRALILHFSNILSEIFNWHG